MMSESKNIIYTKSRNQIEAIKNMALNTFLKLA